MHLQSIRPSVYREVRDYIMNPPFSFFFSFFQNYVVFLFSSLLGSLLPILFILFKFTFLSFCINLWISIFFIICTLIYLFFQRRDQKGIKLITFLMEASIINIEPIINEKNDNVCGLFSLNLYLLINSFIHSFIYSFFIYCNTFLFIYFIHL